MYRAGDEPDMTEQVIIYRTGDIENHPDLLLTRADLLLVALLVGGNYDVSLPFLISNHLLIMALAWDQGLWNGDRRWPCSCRIPSARVNERVG